MDIQILQDLSVFEIFLSEKSLSCRWQFGSQFSINRDFGKDYNSFLHKSPTNWIFSRQFFWWNLSEATNTMEQVFVIPENKINVATLNIIY